MRRFPIFGNWCGVHGGFESRDETRRFQYTGINLASRGRGHHRTSASTSCRGGTATPTSCRHRRSRRVPQALTGWRINFARRWHSAIFITWPETLHFDNARIAQQLYNSDPRNLDALESRRGVKATVRDGWIKLMEAADALERAKTTVRLVGRFALKRVQPFANSPTPSERRQT